MTPNRVAKDFQDGVAAHCRGDFHAAARLYAQVIAAEPMHSGAVILAILVAQDISDHASVIALFDRVSNRSFNSASMVPMAEVLLARGRPDEAMSALLLLSHYAPNADTTALRAAVRSAQNKLKGTVPPPAAFTRDILIVAPIHVASDKEKTLIEFWRAAVERFNPGIDWLMVDDGSPADWLAVCDFGPDVTRIALDGSTPRPVPLVGPHTVAGFGTNFGHPLSHGRDGPARSIATGMAAAIANGYRHVVVLENDLYTRVDLRAAVGQMRASGAKVVTKRVQPFKFVETGFMICDAAHVSAVRFAERYPYLKPILIPQPEWLYEAILGEVTAAPWRGGRNDDNRFDASTVSGLDFLTHCRDLDLYRKFIGI